MTELSAEAVVSLLGLEPLAREGGMWAQTWVDDNGTGIYFLMTPGDFSHLHRLGEPELWHFYAGAPVQMVLLGTTEASSPVLHNRLTDGSRPQVTVAPGIAMGAYTTGDWSLVGTTMAPPFNPATFEIVNRSEALAQYPELEDHIMAVTDPQPR